MEDVDSICVKEWTDEDDESDEVLKGDSDVVVEDTQVLVEVQEGRQVGKLCSSCTFICTFFF